MVYRQRLTEIQPDFVAIGDAGPRTVGKFLSYRRLNPAGRVAMMDGFDGRVRRVRAGPTSGPRDRRPVPKSEMRANRGSIPIVGIR